MPKQPEQDSEGNYILRGVAIWDEHEDDARPEALKKVDRATLALFAENTNARIRDTNERLPIGLSWHTPKPGESFPPPQTVGYYDSLRIGRIGYEKPRAAILADLHIEPKHWDSAITHQRRSIEAFPQTRDLDALILLGAKAPARDLGPLTQPIHYDRGKGACVRYEMTSGADDKETPMDDPNAAPDQGVTLSAESMQALGAMIKGVVMETLQEALAEAPAAEEELAPEGAGDELPPELMEGADEPGGSAPEGELPPDQAAEEDKEKYMRHDEAVRYARLEAENKALKASKQATDAKLAVIELERTKEHYERKISDLQAQGFQIDKTEVMPRLMKQASNDDRDDLLNLLAKSAGRAFPRLGGGQSNYSRASDPVSYEPANGHSKANGELTPEQARKAREYAITNKTDYEAGRAHVLANGAA
jgi:hypothetical protein